MADTPWTVVAWNPDDPITATKLQQMSNNIDWIRQTAARARYKNAVQRETGVRLLGGIATIPKQNDSFGQKEVNFDDFFTTDCIPIITNGIVSTHRRIHVTITGLGQFIPDERGFRIQAQMDNPNTKNKNNVLDSKILVPWLAMGY